MIPALYTRYFVVDTLLNQPLWMRFDIRALIYFLVPDNTFPSTNTLEQVVPNSVVLK